MQKIILVETGDVESSRVLGIFTNKERALLFLKAKLKRDYREERRILRRIYDNHDSIRLVKETNIHKNILESWQIDTGIHYWIQARYLTVNTENTIMTGTWIVVRKTLGKYFEIVCSTKSKETAISKTEENIKKLTILEDIEIKKYKVINRNSLIKYEYGDYEWIISYEEYFDT